jgi:hypothetical protein
VLVMPRSYVPISFSEIRSRMGPNHSRKKGRGGGGA